VISACVIIIRVIWDMAGIRNTITMPIILNYSIITVITVIEIILNYSIIAIILILIVIIIATVIWYTCPIVLYSLYMVCLTDTIQHIVYIQYMVWLTIIYYI